MKKIVLLLSFIIATIEASEHKNSLNMDLKNHTKNSYITKDGLELSTYFYLSDSNLSQRYLKKSAEYFELYKNMFGFMPFKSFSVVEAPSPVGYSMPAYTLIGKQIIDKDYVLDSSLGHEIAHQWFGNYVYSPERGNWAEGITTYYADFLYAKNDNRGAEYRKDMLVKYNSYVDQNNEIALTDFEHKTKNSKNAIGYEKSAFFFYMLEQKIGQKAFDTGTKMLLENYPFKIATYENLREIYEKTSGMKLGDFFKTWVYEKGALDFSISNTALNFVENRYILEFDIISNNKAEYIPVSICSDDECLSTKIDLSKERQRLELDIEPIKIVFDENYELFRKLSTQETPAVISKIIESNALLVISRADEKRFASFRKIFQNFKYADTLTYNEIKNSNIFILGAKNELLERIVLPFKMEGDAKIELFKNPLNEANVIAVFEATKPFESLLYKLKHLGKYSTVIFEGEKIVEKTIKPSQKGVLCKIESGSYALKPTPQKLNEVIDKIVKSRVVYVGESHMEFSSHLNQLKIIKAMYKNNPKLSIGMEMFQKQFQKYLDEFVLGKISEKEMIKKTEYFKRWKYDYELYRPIMLFVKENRIPIVALNIDREITKKVVGTGFDSLSKEQLAEVPNSINFDNEKYKEQLREVYGMHQAERFENFEQFYHAQLLWDESMAANMVLFLQKNPDYSMAVLAGNGHVMHGYGIPSRAERRGITDYKIVLNLTNPEPEIGDYILYPSAVGTTKAKKLGVYFESDEKLHVKKIADNSLAQKAQIKEGDNVVAFNKTAVKNLYELKTELAFAKESVTLTIERESKKIEVEIEFKE
ncbi:ChaN family lipoprotein [Sulfurimonas sp.]|uniref:ChaN family lipoprotein n=1 Tax=Sulfurimonas sp. TaxID=2022749 RepID=UPI0025E43AFD|nr:ChaN family lipoprotein [Sulfurimonas sp.]MBW6487986.1 ChaN family lipoprotein [Sulfurimonas sp.]